MKWLQTWIISSLFRGGEGNVLYTVNNELRGLSFLGNGLLWGRVRL